MACTTLPKHRKRDCGPDPPTTQLATSWMSNPCLADQIEDELAQLTHERHLVQLGLMDVGQTMLHTDAPPPPVSQNGRNGVDGAAAGGVVGKGGVGGLSNVTDSVASYALEMQIQIKRAEREKKRQARCIFVSFFLRWLYRYIAEGRNDPRTTARGSTK